MTAEEAVALLAAMCDSLETRARKGGYWHPEAPLLSVGVVRDILNDTERPPT